MSGLTSDQLDFYRTQGYLLVEDVIDPSVFDRLINEINAIVDTAAQEAHAAGELSELHADLPFAKRLVHIHSQLADPEPLLRQVNGKLKTEGMFAILTQPALLDIVESVIGPKYWLIRNSICAPNCPTKTPPWCLGTKTWAICSPTRKRPSWSIFGFPWSMPLLKTAAWKSLPAATAPRSSATSTA